MKSPFKAYLIEEGAGQRSRGRMTSFAPEGLDAGEVTIRVQWSGINYKDVLAATGGGRIVRRFPCIGGVDLAGVVEVSDDPRFCRGDVVLATGYGLGVSHHGGYAEYARLPAAWVLPLPTGLSAFEAMALGTAGFTAALGILRMEACGLSPQAGPVLVTGASGGVGRLAIDMLAVRGYEVVALTGKPGEGEALKALGAHAVLQRGDIDFAAVKPLEAARWGGVVDSVGGQVLHWALASARPGGLVASIGNVADSELKTSVFPFILRGVSVLGIDSVNVPLGPRNEVWRRLATDLKPWHLHQLARTIDFDALPSAMADAVAGRISGRTVVRIGE